MQECHASVRKALFGVFRIAFTKQSLNQRVLYKKKEGVQAERKNLAMEKWEISG
jgi:hypothetical protein